MRRQMSTKLLYARERQTRGKTRSPEWLEKAWTFLSREIEIKGKVGRKVEKKNMEATRGRVKMVKGDV